MTINIIDAPYSKDFSIYKTDFTVDQLEEMTEYGGDARETFTNEEINELATNIQDAVQQVIEDFLNHR
jgi:hypothetical protein